MSTLQADALDILQSRIDDADTESSLLNTVRNALKERCPHCEKLRNRVVYLEDRLGVVSVEADTAAQAFDELRRKAAHARKKEIIASAIAKLTPEERMALDIK